MSSKMKITAPTMIPATVPYVSPQTHQSKNTFHTSLLVTHCHQLLPYKTHFNSCIKNTINTINTAINNKYLGGENNNLFKQVLVCDTSCIFQLNSLVSVAKMIISWASVQSPGRRNCWLLFQNYSYACFVINFSNIKKGLAVSSIIFDNRRIRSTAWWHSINMYWVYIFKQTLTMIMIRKKLCEKLCSTAPPTDMTAANNHVIMQTNASDNLLLLTRRRSASEASFGRQFRAAGARDAVHPDHVVSINVQCRQVVWLGILVKNDALVGYEHSTDPADTYPWSNNAKTTLKCHVQISTVW